LGDRVRVTRKFREKEIRGVSKSCDGSPRHRESSGTALEEENTYIQNNLTINPSEDEDLGDRCNRWLLWSKKRSRALYWPKFVTVEKKKF
jgi:hypothetical protein